MPRIGSKQRPARLRVRSMDRAGEIAQLAEEHGVKFMIGIEPDQPEDISDLELALGQGGPVSRPPKVGRNDPCPCGSGKKYKKCCGRSARRW